MVGSATRAGLLPPGLEGLEMTMDRRAFVGGLASVGGVLALGVEGAFARLIASGGEPAGTLLEWDEARKGAFAMVDLATGGNSLVLISEGESLVVDTKSPLLGAAIRGDAGALGGISGVTLLNTHHHGDHTGGNAAFADVISYAHKNALPRIEAQIGRYRSGAERASGEGAAMEAIAARVREDAPSWTAKHFVPDKAIGDDGATLEIGDERAEISHYGAGHTDNDLVVRVPGLNLVHTGDLVFSGLHAFFDPTGGVTAPGWVSSLEGALALCDADTVVIPGHGPIGDRSIIQGAIDYLAALIEAVQGELDKGTTKENTQEKSWAFMDGLGFEGVRPRAIGAVYDELIGG